MMKLLRVACVVFGVAASTVAAAPAVRLSFSDGRVWLSANGATVGQILAEWARVGGTHVVNGERVAGQPLTLELSGVPEMQALDIVLRSAGGFIAAARPPEQDSAAANVSRFGQITVLPPGAPPRADVASRTGTDSPPPASTPPPIFTASGARRILDADGQPVPDDQ